MTVVEDPYRVLGIPSTATKDEIKRAYRKKAKEYHPDLHPNDPNAARKMNEVNEAYDMLINPEKYKGRRENSQRAQHSGTTQAGSGGNRNTNGNAGKPAFLAVATAARELLRNIPLNVHRSEIFQGFIKLVKERGKVLAYVDLIGLHRGLLQHRGFVFQPFQEIRGNGLRHALHLPSLRRGTGARPLRGWHTI